MARDTEQVCMCTCVRVSVCGDRERLMLSSLLRPVNSKGYMATLIDVTKGPRASVMLRILCFVSYSE